MNRRTWLQALVPPALVIGATLAPGPAASAQTTSCAPADALAERTVETLKDYVTSADTISVKMAKALGITGTNPDRIRYTTDPKICSAAVKAWNQESQTPGRSRTLHVWVVGSDYAAEDPSDTDGAMSYRAVLFFTSKWRVKSRWAPN